MGKKKEAKQLARPLNCKEMVSFAVPSNVSHPATVLLCSTQNRQNASHGPVCITPETHIVFALSGASSCESVVSAVAEITKPCQVELYHEHTSEVCPCAIVFPLCLGCFILGGLCQTIGIIQTIGTMPGHVSLTSSCKQHAATFSTLFSTAPRGRGGSHFPQDG